MMRERLGYLHVPKAAGSSVTDAIRRAVLDLPPGVDGPAAVCPALMDMTLFGSFAQFGSLPEGTRKHIFLRDARALGEYDVVIGHFAASNLLAGRTPADLAVLVREPVSRLASLHAFWRSWSPEQHEAWLPYDASKVAAAHGWDEFLADPALASQTDNVLARLLLAPDPRIPPDGFIAPQHVEPLRTEAVAAMAAFGHVDAIEHGESCWTRLARWSGLELAVGHRNATPEPTADGPSPTARLDAEGLAARTAIDRELWVEAVRRWAPGRSRETVLAEGAQVAEERLHGAGPGAPRSPTVRRAGSVGGRVGAAWRRAVQRSRSRSRSR